MLSFAVYHIRLYPGNKVGHDGSSEVHVAFFWRYQVPYCNFKAKNILKKNLGNLVTWSDFEHQSAFKRHFFASFSEIQTMTTCCCELQAGTENYSFQLATQVVEDPPIHSVVKRWTKKTPKIQWFFSWNSRIFCLSWKVDFLHQKHHCVFSIGNCVGFSFRNLEITLSDLDGFMYNMCIQRCWCLSQTPGTDLDS